jgi:hypothetical protein
VPTTRIANRGEDEGLSGEKVTLSPVMSTEFASNLQISRSPETLAIGWTTWSSLPSLFFSLRESYALFYLVFLPLQGESSPDYSLAAGPCPSAGRKADEFSLPSQVLSVTPKKTVLLIFQKGILRPSVKVEGFSLTWKR